MKKSIKLSLCLFASIFVCSFASCMLMEDTSGSSQSESVSSVKNEEETSSSSIEEEVSSSSIEAETSSSSIEEEASSSSTEEIASSDKTNDSDSSEVTETYTVNLPVEQVGYTLTSDVTTVNEGDSVTLTLAIGTQYHATESFAVKANGEVLTGNEGVYVLENVTENVTVTVEGVAINTYAITLPTEQTGYTLTADNAEVNAGDSVTLTLTIGAQYHTTEDFAVKANGEALTGIKGVYVIENVTENVTVTAEGVAINTYAITLPTEQTGYTLTADNAEVNAGGNVTLTLAIGTQYHATESFAVKANGEVLTGNEGVYVLENVTENVTVTVEGIEINTYTVTYMSYDGSEALKTESITHGMSGSGYTATADNIIEKYSYYAEANGSKTVDITKIEGNVTVYCLASAWYKTTTADEPLLKIAEWTTVNNHHDGDWAYVKADTWAAINFGLCDYAFVNDTTVEFEIKNKTESGVTIAYNNASPGFYVGAGITTKIKIVKDETGLITWYQDGVAKNTTTDGTEITNLNQLQFNIGAGIAVFVSPLTIVEPTEKPVEYTTVKLDQPLAKIAEWTVVNNNHDGDWAYVKADVWAAINFGLCDYAFVNGTTVEFEIKNTTENGASIAYNNNSPGFYVGTGITTKIKIVKDETGLITWYQDGVAKNTTTDGTEITNLNQLQFNITEGVALFVSPLTVTVPNS